MRKFLRRLFVSVELVNLSVLSYFPLHIVRILSLKIFGAQVSSGVTVYHGYQVRAARKLTIGARTSIGDGAILDARGGLVIGSDVNFSTRVQVWTAQHDWQSNSFEYISAPVTIGDRAWIGPNSVILPGTVVGTGAVIAAGAVVKGTVPPFTLVGGVPAKHIANRPADLSYELAPSRSKVYFW